MKNFRFADKLREMPVDCIGEWEKCGEWTKIQNETKQIHANGGREYVYEIPKRFEPIKQQIKGFFFKEGFSVYERENHLQFRITW